MVKTRRTMATSPTKARQPAPIAPVAGTIALVGRPNVGKSTLLNRMLGEHIAITSHHPQTTRDRVAGILTLENAQLVFQDTPGLHKPKNRLGQRMNIVAEGAASESDVVVFVTAVDSQPQTQVTPEDKQTFAAIPKGRPIVLVINKIDRVQDKAHMIDMLAAYGALHDFAAVIPLSAKKETLKKGSGIDRLIKELRALLPEGPPLYPTDELSDRPVRFFVAEIVREQVLMRTREEVPHGVAVTVDAYEEQKKVVRITLSIHVAKDSHKGIIIGQGGKMLQTIGAAARERVERLIGQRVHLDIHVRATPGWFDDAARLVDLGYSDEAGKAKAKSKSSRRSSSKSTSKSKSTSQAGARSAGADTKNKQQKRNGAPS